MSDIYLIKTERLYLRKIIEEDRNNFVNWRRDKDYYKYLPSVPLNKEKLNAKFDGLLNDSKSISFSIILKSTNEFIGCITIERIDMANFSCELSWGLVKSYQKKGYALEALKAILAYLNNRKDINRIEIYIWSGNVDSQKLAENAGFIYEGTNRQSKFKDGQFYDVLNYSIVKNIDCFTWNNFHKQLPN